MQLLWFEAYWSLTLFTYLLLLSLTIFPLLCYERLKIPLPFQTYWTSQFPDDFSPYQSTMILRFGGAICPRKRARCVTVYMKSGGKSFSFNCEGLVVDNLYCWTSMCVLLSIQCAHVMCLSSSLDILSSKRLFVDLVKIPPHVSFTGSWEGDKEKVRTQLL